VLDALLNALPGACFAVLMGWNWQAALVLAGITWVVYATDISEKQIANAVRRNNIIYKIESAENTSFANNMFDLITVAQAIHWFNFDKFYSEVKRTAKPGGVLAVIGYGLLQTIDKLNDAILHFYRDIVGSYWDKERRYIDVLYATIPFPFKEIQTPQLKMEYQWTRDQFVGYLNTWSSVQHFIKANKEHPLTDELLQGLKILWAEDEVHNISFPLLLRIGHQ